MHAQNSFTLHQLFFLLIDSWHGREQVNATSYHSLLLSQSLHIENRHRATKLWKGWLFRHTAPFCITVVISVNQQQRSGKKRLSGIVCYSCLCTVVIIDMFRYIYSVSKGYRRLISSHCDVTGTFLCPHVHSCLKSLCIVWSLPFCHIPRIFFVAFLCTSMNALGDQILLAWIHPAAMPSC